MPETVHDPARPSDASGAALASAAALMHVASRERTLLQAGRTQVSFALAIASAGAWSYAAFATAAVLR